MEIKETVKTKLVHAKDEIVAFAAEVTPYVTTAIICGAITYVAANGAYAMGYNKGLCSGAQAGRNAVIEIVNDLAKKVETK